jgi:hypothetical protein
MEAFHSRRTYDYRIQEAICESGDRELFPELNIPRSTIRSWIHRGAPDVVAGGPASDDYAELAAVIERLRHRAALLGAVVGIGLLDIRSLAPFARRRQHRKRPRLASDTPRLERVDSEIKKVEFWLRKGYG